MLAPLAAKLKTRQAGRAELVPLAHFFSPPENFPTLPLPKLSGAFPLAAGGGGGGNANANCKLQTYVSSRSANRILAGGLDSRQSLSIGQPGEKAGRLLSHTLRDSAPITRPSCSFWPGARAWRHRRRAPSHCLAQVGSLAPLHEDACPTRARSGVSHGAVSVVSYRPKLSSNSAPRALSCHNQ